MWVLCLAATGIVSAQDTTKSVELFGMQCTVQESVGSELLADNTNPIYTFQSGLILENTLLGDVLVAPDIAEYRYLKHLEKKGYTSVSKINNLYVEGVKIKVVLGEKCGKNVLRLNTDEYLDTVGILDVHSDGEQLFVYYQAGTNNVNAIVCSPFTQEEIIIDKTKTAEEMIVAEELTFVDWPVVEFEEGTILWEVTLPSIERTIAEYKQLKAWTLYELVKQRGYDWTTDRLELAGKAGIDTEKYRGTREQNLQIKTYLLNQIEANIETSVTATSTPKITVPESKYPAVEKAELWKISELRGYEWIVDKFNIAKEFGFDIVEYIGDKAQNLKIRERFLSKVSPREE